MRRKLLLALALAVLGTAVTAAVVNADSGTTTTTATTTTTTTTSTDPGTNPTGGQNPPPATSRPACSNGKDDDGDGLIDSADPGCSGPLDNNESDPAPPPPGGGTGGGGTGGVRRAVLSCDAPRVFLARRRSRIFPRPRAARICARAARRGRVVVRLAACGRRRAPRGYRSDAARAARKRGSVRVLTPAWVPCGGGARRSVRVPDGADCHPADRHAAERCSRSGAPDGGRGIGRRRGCRMDHQPRRCGGVRAVARRHHKARRGSGCGWARLPSPARRRTRTRYVASGSSMAVRILASWVASSFQGCS